MNTLDYNSAIDQIFDRLDAQHDHLKTSKDIDLMPWQLGAFIGGVGMGLVAAHIMGLADPITSKEVVSSVGFFGVGMALTGFGASPELGEKMTNACLGLAGRSLPLFVNREKELSQWGEQHPRLAHILNEWSKQRADGQLNLHDYNAVSRAMTQVNVAKWQARQGSVDESLSDAFAPKVPGSARPA